MSKLEGKVWYAMRATYRRELDAKKLLEEQSIQTFVPMRYELRIKGKHKKREIVPVIHNLIFVYAYPSEIQSVKKTIPYLQYMMDFREGNKIIVPEEQMRRFIAVTGTYDEQLMFFKPEELNLSKGTKVRVRGGDFEGQEGIFLKVKGARDKRVVIAIQGVIAVALATISPDLIEVISE